MTEIVTDEGKDEAKDEISFSQLKSFGASLFTQSQRFQFE
jgi:hypothetical protein